MNAQPDTGTLLTRALDQTAGLLDEVSPDQFDQPSTCADWKVGDLVRHVVASPAELRLDVLRQGGRLGQPARARRRPGGGLSRGCRRSSSSRSEPTTLWSRPTRRSQSSPCTVGTSRRRSAARRRSTTRWPSTRSPSCRANLTPENRKGAFGPEVDAAPAPRFTTDWLPSPDAQGSQRPDLHVCPAQFRQTARARCHPHLTFGDRSSIFEGHISVPQAPAGWFPLPDGTHRYWDGSQWLMAIPTPPAPPSMATPSTLSTAGRDNGLAARLGGWSTGVVAVVAAAVGSPCPWRARVWPWRQVLPSNPPPKRPR